MNKQDRLQKEASMYLPGRKENPGAGFSAQAGLTTDYPLNDPYTTYHNAIDNSQIWQALMKEGARQALGAQMAIPIRETLDYQGMCRRYFEIDVLAQGQIARYDRDIDAFATTISKRGEVIDFITEGTYVEPDTWEIFAPNGIRLSEIQQRRFNVLDRLQEKIRIQIQLEEDAQFLALCNSTVLANVANNTIETSAAGVSKTFLRKVFAQVIKHDLPVYSFLMHPLSYTHLFSWDTSEVDPVTMREILESGLRARVWGVDLVVSRQVPTNAVFCMTEPRFFGVMPVRYLIAALVGDDQRKNLRKCRKISLRQSAAKPAREGSETVMRTTATKICPVCKKSFRNRQGVMKHLFRWTKNEPKHVEFLSREREEMILMFDTSELSCSRIFRKKMFWQDIRRVWRETFTPEQVELRRRKKIRETINRIYSDGTMDWLRQKNSLRGKQRFVSGELEFLNLTPMQLEYRRQRLHEYYENNSPTLEQRQKNSDGVKKAYAEGRKTVKFSHGVGGFRKDLGHFVRSRWEANICRIFRLLDIEYIYEPKRFVLNDGATYLPDFYLPKDKCYLEVKGGFPFENTNKMVRFISETDQVLYLIRKKEYKKLKGFYKHFISDWENEGVAVGGTVRAAWRHAELDRNVLTTSKFFEVVTKLTDVILMPDDEPKRALISYVGYISDPNTDDSIRKLSYMLEHPVKLSVPKCKNPKDRDNQQETKRFYEFAYA